jgi:Xaa-Pro aminopeptidase
MAASLRISFDSIGTTVVLHYIENSKMKVENDLVLMDLGAEYHGYTADVTRTIPANGKFSTEQKTYL